MPLSQAVLGGFRFSSKIVKVSIELLRDSGFDLTAYLAGRLAIRLARVFNQKFTNGTGVAEPSGLITLAAVGADAIGSSGNSGGSETGATSIGTADLAALEKSVDPAYRNNASYMMHSDTLGLLRQVVSKSGLPVFPGLQLGGIDTIFGYPLVVNNSMSALSANRTPSSPQVALKTVAFGALDRYVVRRAPMIVYQLREKYAEYGQAAYLCYQRADGKLLDGGGGAVKVLTNTY